ncbi:MAG TPA: TetR/AcrR family transcriptional regulator [Sporichthyaceae bacterium]|nr:TetR/AcrR family transcriptional regulator [Sporichthyaceae bacterium]
MSQATLDSPRTARQRLVMAADQLFYAEGINSVGIDRVIEHAGVAKATLYSAFGSKDGLIRAYLMRRHDLRTERIMRHVNAHSDPREKVLAVFDSLAELFATPGWRGCPFLASPGETRSGDPVDEITTLTRAWTRALFTELAAAIGMADQPAVADALMNVYDGAIVASQLDHKADAAQTARRLAAMVIAA